MQKTQAQLTLSDGRTLAYSEYGDRDPHSPVMVYCHGFPTCRMEPEIFDPILREQGINARIIALDRPGYGGSTHQPGRTFLNWPADVAEAMDMLGVGDFSILGVSGGAPFAMACASKLGLRVSRLGIAVGIGPPAATGIEKSLIFRTAPRLHLIARIQFALFAKGLERGQDERIFRQTIENLGAADVPVLERPETKDWFIRMLRETFKQGGRAAALEAGLYVEEWGFEPTDIETETHLWYGGRDETVPPSVGEWLAERIPNSTLEIWQDHGHFTWMLTEESAELIRTIASGH